MSGFYDFGPLGATIKANIENLWRHHFILEDDMLEIFCTNIMLEDVLKASGHVDKFADFMVKDLKNGQCYRADKLINEAITKMLAKKKNEEERAKLEKVILDCENYGVEEINACI